jgi:hypothetical protein
MHKVFAVLLLAAPFAAMGGVISSGTIVIPNTFTFSLDTGTLGGNDIWWENLTNATTPDLQFVPLGSAELVNIGITNFANVTPAELMGLTYGTTALPQGSLPVDDVFAVLTNGGNYAKVEILDYQNTNNIDANVQWVTYSATSAAVPEPGSGATLGLGLATIGLLLAGRTLSRKSPRLKNPQ